MTTAFTPILLNKNEPENSIIFTNKWGGKASTD
jgi:hypothetical protein